MDKSAQAHVPADKAVVGFFTDGNAGESGYRLLKEMGYGEDEISVLLSDESKKLYFSSPGLRGEVVGNATSSSGSGPAVGAALGAGAGAVLGGAIAVAAVIALPGISLIALGPLAAIVTGSGFGGLSGGLLGSVVGVAIPQDEANGYEEKLRKGHILLGVSPRSREDRIQIMNEWDMLGAEVIRQPEIPDTNPKEVPPNPPLEPTSKLN